VRRTSAVASNQRVEKNPAQIFSPSEKALSRHNSNLLANAFYRGFVVALTEVAQDDGYPRL
jgi:hypothetical protein